MRFAFALVLFALFLPAVWGQQCSDWTIRGTYSVSCTGFISPGPNAPQVPFNVLVIVKNGTGGNISGGGKVSMGGAILDQTVTGKAVVNEDCTGTVSYDQKINGQPAPKLNVIFHILDFGREIRGLSVDAGTNLSCNLRRISM